MDFSNLIFYNVELNFSSSEFKDKVYFIGTKFVPENPEKPKSNIIFYDTTFCEEVNFNSAQFNTIVDFENVAFDKEVNFSNVIFNCEAIFEEVYFDGELSFCKTIFNKKTTFLSGLFNSVEFE